MVHCLLLSMALMQGFDTREPATRPRGSARGEVVRILKSLTAERALVPASPSRITIGVILDPESAASLRSAESMRREFLAAEDQLGRPIRVSMIEISERGMADPEGLDVVYVTPVRPGMIEQIVDWTRRHRLISFTGVQAFVEQGLVVGVGPSGQIVVNRTASKAIGAEFSSRLLRVARVID